MVEREGYAFYVQVVYEKLPEYCNHCQTIGHSVTVCHKIHPKSVATDACVKKHVLAKPSTKAVFVAKGTAQAQTTSVSGAEQVTPVPQGNANIDIVTSISVPQGKEARADPQGQQASADVIQVRQADDSLPIQSVPILEKVADFNMTDNQDNDIENSSAEFNDEDTIVVHEDTREEHQTEQDETEDHTLAEGNITVTRISLFLLNRCKNV
ncbi:DEAD-box ATP-dependent RNA helicase [Trifolium medium]|uniref:DEAD-box ATP-dependent RNA helicase n=1 Tax=Trifolium medium TaxID=97028 RepID=A0A392PFH5_9FABA|nr:DEAD-box ATP-dependent RNA helicase [Trifolium medium]